MDYSLADIQQTVDSRLRLVYIGRSNIAAVLFVRGRGGEVRAGSAKTGRRAVLNERRIRGEHRVLEERGRASRGTGRWAAGGTGYMRLGGGDASMRVRGTRGLRWLFVALAAMQEGDSAADCRPSWCVLPLAARQTSTPSAGNFTGATHADWPRLPRPLLFSSSSLPPLRCRLMRETHPDGRLGTCTRGIPGCLATPGTNGGCPRVSAVPQVLRALTATWRFLRLHLGCIYGVPLLKVHRQQRETSS